MGDSGNTTVWTTSNNEYCYVSQTKSLSPKSVKILTRYMSENIPPQIINPPQVTFHGIQDVYDPNEKMTCCFTFSERGSTIQPGDAVAICELGWKKLCDIRFYVPAEINFFDKWICLYSIIFEVDNLPNGSGIYELCYLSEGKILGCSTPFTFEYSPESEFIAVEDPNDPGLVIFKSRNSQGDVSSLSKVNLKVMEIVETEISTKNIEENVEYGKSLEKDFEAVESEKKSDAIEGNMQSEKSLQKDFEAVETEIKSDIIEENVQSKKSLQKSCMMEASVASSIASLPQSFELLSLTPLITSSVGGEDNSASPEPFITVEQNELECQSSDMDSSLVSLPDAIELLSICQEPCCRGPERDLKKSICGLNEVLMSDNQVTKSIPIPAEDISRLENMTDKPTSSLYGMKQSMEEVGAPELKSISRVIHDQHDQSEHFKLKTQEHEALSAELLELKETNAFLKSRVSVLELELTTLKDNKHNLLMRCINSYEQENASLKDELEKHIKYECTIESLRSKCEKLEEENCNLITYIKNSLSGQEAGFDLCETLMETRMLRTKCSNLELEISQLKKNITLEKSTQNFKTSRCIRDIILKQGHELAFMRSEFHEIREGLRSLMGFFDLPYQAPENYSGVKAIMDALENKCSIVIQRNSEKVKLFGGHDTLFEENQNLASEVKSLRHEVQNSYKQNVELREQLISLRKQTIGKISLQSLPK